MKHVLEASGIRHFYGNLNLLTDVYLKCETGDLIGLLGRNGTGKSTLLKIIFGSLKGYNQTIIMDGKFSEKLYTEKNAISYLPQHSFLPFKDKVEQVIKLYVEDERKRKTIYLDEKIKPNLDKEVRELSGGNLKYLEVTLLLAQPTKFILLDEPFSGISPIDRENIAQQIEKHKKDKGIIITDHDYETVLKYCDKIFLLSNGVCKEIKEHKELEFYNYLPKGKLSN